MKVESENFKYFGIKINVSVFIKYYYTTIQKKTEMIEREKTVII